MENDDMKELRSMMMDLVKQNIQTNQRIDSLGQRMEQSNALLSQRIDSLGQRMEQSNALLSQRIDGMVQQNMILSQRMDASNQRMDAALQQTQQQQLEIAKMFYEIRDCLERLPDAIKDQIGFKQ